MNKIKVSLNNFRIRFWCMVLNIARGIPNKANKIADVMVKIASVLEVIGYILLFIEIVKWLFKKRE